MSAMQTAEERLAELLGLRDRIDEEIVRIHDASAGGRRRSRNVVPPCGTETGYQRHRLLGEDCARCKSAHAIHERIVLIVRSTRKRLTHRQAGAA